MNGVLLLALWRLLHMLGDDLPQFALRGMWCRVQGDDADRS